jgi:hypothetical protein
MNAWKAVCVAEVLAICVTWWLLGGRPPAPAASFSGAAAAVDAVHAADLLADSPRSPTDVPSVAQPQAGPLEHAPRHWSSPTGNISLLFTVEGPGGATVDRFSYRWTIPGNTSRWTNGSPSSRHFVLDDLQPGVVNLEVQAPGHLALQVPITILSEPPVQRHTLTLERGWRVILWARTTTGATLQTWLQESANLKPRSYRIKAMPVRESPRGHLAAKEQIHHQNALGAFVSGSSNASALPKGCVGALDLLGQPPLLAAFWLDRIYLGCVPVEAGDEEAVLIVHEEDLLQSFARVRFRAVDGASGTPLQGVEGSLTHAWGGGGPMATTDESGHAEFRFVPPDNYDLDFTLPGYADGYREIQVEPGATLDLGDLALHATGTLRALVLDPSGEPADAERFQFFPTSGWTRPEEPRRYAGGTDAAGKLEMRAGAGRYQAIFGGRDGIGLQAVVWERGSAEPEERVIRLQAGVETRLLAQSPEISTRLLWLSDREGRLLSSSRLADGSPWTLVLTPGDYLLRVEDLGRNLLTTLDLHVPDGGGEIRVALP